MTLREKILQANDIRTEDVHVPEWGCALRVRAMTGAERAEFERRAVNSTKSGEELARRYAELVVDLTTDPETGEPVFSRPDRDALMQKAGSAINAVAHTALKLSGMTQDEVTEIEKN